MTTSKQSKAVEKAESLAKLRAWLKPGDTVHTILRHVSKSGMTRDIGIIILLKNGDGTTSTIHPNHAVATLLGLPLKRDSVRISGCGMDMGFEIVYNLGRVLFPDGSATNSEHAKRDSGYALRHEWL